jgi:GLPGLI family protein
MKKIFLLALTLFIISNGFSQESGIVNYTKTTNWTKMMESSKTMSKADKERMVYTWGNNREFEHKAELKFNLGEYRFEYQENEEYSRWRKEDDYIIYRDRVNNQTFDVLSLLEKQYVIRDSIVCQHWKIKNDMKEVAGRICMNASYFDTIKEKEVMAWFALDLPVSIGPDHYCGLPGMILEIIEANGAVVITATGILLSEEKVTIEKPEIKKSRKSITQKEYNKKLLDYINECKKMQRPYFWGGVAF